MLSRELNWLNCFKYQAYSAGYGQRSYPWKTGWRALPAVVLEFPENGSWFVDREEGRALTVDSEDVMVLPAKYPHRLRMRSGTPMHSLWIIGAFEDALGRDLIGMLSVPRVIRRAQAGRLRILMRKMLNVDRQARKGQVMALARQHVLAFQALEQLIKVGDSERRSLMNPALERLLPALAYLRAHLDQPLTRADLARRVHLSPTRFHYVFEEAMGVAPMAFVLNERIQRACELLCLTDHPISLIASKCGFASAYYFSRAFKKKMNKNPTAYRAGMSSFQS